MKEMDQRINAQVSHLTYERPSSPEQKLGGYEMLRVKEAIDRGVKLFAHALAPEYEGLWIPPVPSKWRIEFDGTLCATNQTTSISVIILGGAVR